MVSSLENWDGSLSSTVKQNGSRLTDLAESAEAFISHKKTTVPDERSSTLGNGHGVYDRMTSLNMNHTNDASNVYGPLSRDIPTLLARKTSSFTPVSSSPLHNTVNRLPVQTPIVLTLPSLVSSPPPVHMDTLETISTYTADGDGDVEVEDVTDMMASTSGRNNHEQNERAPSCDSPLFTPPPEEDALSIHQFTSYPSPKQTQVEPSSVYRKPRSRRCIMSHVEVPPLKRPRSDYRPDYRPSSKSLPTIVHKRRVAFNSVEEALQASLQNNANIGVFSGNLDKQKHKRMKQRRDGAAEIVVGRPNETKKLLKRSFIDDDDDDDWSPPPKFKKLRPIPAPVIVDLTITDEDDPDFLPHRKISSSALASKKQKPKVKPTPKPPISKPIPRPRPMKKPQFIHAKYNSETDVVTLCLEDIRPVPLEILTLNTRFLRQSLGNDVNANDNGGTLGPVNINCTRKNGSRPCLMIVASSVDSLEEVSVGGVIHEFAEELVEREVIDLLSDSDVLKENVPQKNVPSSSTPLVPSLKNQHQMKPRGPQGPYTKKRKPPHHLVGDDVNGSSSTFKVPAPRAMPDTTEYPKTQYPRKKGREPQHGQQQQPKKQKQSSSKDSTVPIQISPWTIKHAPPHPKKLQDSQLLQPSHNDSPVLPPHSARSSLNGFQVLGSESGSFSGAVPSAKALGKRRAISPTSISATTTPHVPPYSANIQMTSHRSPSSGLTHNLYGLLNSDFNAFMDDPTAISSAVQSLSAEANGADAINAFSLSSSYYPFDTLTSLYDQAASSNRNEPEIINIGSDMDSSRHTSTSLPHVLAYDSQPQSGSGSRGESFFSSDFLNDNVGFPGDHHDQEFQPQQQYDGNNTMVDGGVTWSSSLNQPENQVYAYETIDPTLLGGGSVLGDVESELDAEIDVAGMEAGFEDQVRQKEDNRDNQVEIDSNNESSSPDSSSYASASPPSKKKTYQNKKVEKREETMSYERKLPPRNRVKRVIPDMLSHDDFDLMVKRKQAAKKVISSTSSALDNDSGADRSSSGSEIDDESDEDDDEDDEENKKRTITVRKPVSISKPRVSLKDPIERSVSPPPTSVVDKKSTASRADWQDWPLDEVDAYCHQCRRKTFYAKMTCADCQKKFCVRCYAFRYPECEFDADDEDYSCPACEGFCNCTACCRKRGEAYVGVRRCDISTPPPPPLPRRPRVNLGAKTNVPPSPTKVGTSTIKVKTTTIPEGATNAWGSLYSVTGEKIGACFFDPSAAEKDSSMVFAPATTPIMTTMAEVAQQVVPVVVSAAAGTSEEPSPPVTMTTTKVRVKKKRKTKHKRRIFIGVVQDCWGYTKPRIKQLEAEPYSKRSYNSMPRYFIGKKKCLFYPVEDDESSLTPMDESDEVQELELEGGGDVEGKSFLPDSLGDGDVSRAIFLGLAACGLPVPAI